MAFGTSTIDSLTTAASTTKIYTLSLHDALPIFATRSRSKLGAIRSISLPSSASSAVKERLSSTADWASSMLRTFRRARARSEEHTSELQSQSNLVCRLLLEKKKDIRQTPPANML